MAGPVPSHLIVRFGGTEASFGAGPASTPAAGDAYRHEGGDFPNQVAEVVEVGDKTGYRSQRVPVQGAKMPVPWKLSLLALPPGGAASAPDYGHLLEAGAFSQAGGVYSRALNQTTTAWDYAVARDGTWAQTAAGIITKQAKYSGGEGLAKAEFSGEAAKVSTINETTLGNAIAIGNGTVTLASGHGWVINGAPVYFKVDSESFIGVSIAGDVVTLSANATANHNNGTAVTATVPTHTPTDSDPVADANGTFDLNNGAEEIVTEKWSVTLDTGMEMGPKEYGQTYRTRAICTRKLQAVQCTADLLWLTTYAKLMGYARDLTSKDLLIRIGPAASRRIQIRFPTAKLRKPPATPEVATGSLRATLDLGGYATDGNDVTVSYL